MDGGKDGRRRGEGRYRRRGVKGKEGERDRRRWEEGGSDGRRQEKGREGGGWTER